MKTIHCLVTGLALDLPPHLYWLFVMPNITNNSQQPMSWQFQHRNKIKSNLTTGTSPHSRKARGLHVEEKRSLGTGKEVMKTLLPGNKHCLDPEYTGI
jgi:fatty-acid desaturase